MKPVLYLLALLFILIMACNNIEEKHIGKSNQIKDSSKNNDRKELEEDLIKNLVIYDTSNKEYKLSDVLKTKKTLIFYYTENCCMACIDDYLVILNKMSDLLDNDQLLIIAKNQNIRALKIKRMTYEIEAPFFNTNQPLEISSVGKIKEAPFFVLVDQNLKSSYPRYGETGDSLNNPYFKNLRSLLD